jgi:hypothetical protein
VYLHACNLAAEWEAELTLLHVLERRRAMATIHDEAAERGPAGIDALGWLHDGADRLATGPATLHRSAATQLRNWSNLAGGLDVTTELREGDIVDEIAGAAQLLQPSVIALPAPPPWRRMWWPGSSGSHLILRLLPRLDCPVLLLPREAAPVPAFAYPWPSEPAGALRGA